MKILQVCRSIGRHCGIANFAANLGAAAGIPTEPAYRGQDCDVALIQHEHGLWTPPDLRDVCGRIRGRKVLFAHSPLVFDAADAFVAMAPGMVDTSKPVHVMPHPAYVRPLVDRAELRKRLGLDFKVVVGSHGFAQPNRRFDMFVQQLLPVLEEVDGAVVIAAAEHFTAAQKYHLQFSMSKLRSLAGPRVIVEADYLEAGEVNLLMQACDVAWCWTAAPSKPYASGVASDLYGSGSRLVCADKLQHRAVLGRDNVVPAPEDFAGFFKVLVREIRRGEYPRHDASELSWGAQIGPLMEFLS